MKGLVLLVLLVSCGKVTSVIQQRNKVVVMDIEPAQAEDYEYEFIKLDCTTGSHSFDTFVKACNALKNDEKNNSCAEDDRKDLFESAECPGEFSS